MAPTLSRWCESYKLYQVAFHNCEEFAKQETMSSMGQACLEKEAFSQRRRKKGLGRTCFLIHKHVFMNCFEKPWKSVSHTCITVVPAKSCRNVTIVSWKAALPCHQTPIKEEFQSPKQNTSARASITSRAPSHAGMSEGTWKERDRSVESIRAWRVCCFEHTIANQIKLASSSSAGAFLTCSILHSFWELVRKPFLGNLW